MERYGQIFGGELSMNIFSVDGMEGEGSDGVMHAKMETTAGIAEWGDTCGQLTAQFRVSWMVNAAGQQQG